MTTRDGHAEQPPAGRAHAPAVPLTAFVGRAAELRTADQLVNGSRLVTLTGPGGAGKTRLAAEVARGRTDRHPDGVHWVDLSALTEGAQVAEAVATAVGAAVGAPVVGDQLRTVCVHLSTRRVLLCVDNAEHLLDGVAETVSAVLQSCQGVTVLVTSREPLGLAGEAVLDVPPLSDDDAVALFVDRARLARHGFALDEDSEPAVRSIAAHLDGIPLAIELAAAWMRTLTPRQVEEGLDDRFTLLVRGPRGAQRRQATLAGSIQWSHDLLDGVDRVVFRRLSVFAGTFGMRAAQTLCAGGTASAGATASTADVEPADVLSSIGRLVDKSLVVVDERNGEARYRLLETIRAYATARAVDAKERDDLRTRHLAWCLDLAESAERARESNDDRWRDALLTDYDNLAAALETGLAADDPDAGRRLAASLAWFWHFDRRGRDGLDILRRAIERSPDDRSVLQARLLTGFALVADTAEPLDVEYDAAARAAALAGEVGDDGLLALSLNLLAVGAFYVDFDEAWRLCDQAAAAAEASGSIVVRGGARALQAMILHLQERHEEASALADHSVMDALQHHRGILSTLLVYQADGAFACGDPARAQAMAEEALLVAEPLGDYLRLGFARSMVAQLVALRGDPAGAAEVLEPIIRFAGRAEVFVPGLDSAAAEVSMLSGDAGAAVGRLRPSAASTERGSPTWMAGRALPRLGAALAAAGRTDEAAAVLDRAVEVCRRLHLPGALADALFAQAELAAADRGSDPGGLARATELHHAALTIRIEHGLTTAQLDSLEALARIEAAQKATPDVVRMLSAASSARARLGIPLSVAQRAAHDAVLAALRRALGDAAVDAAAAEGERLPLDQAVSSVRRARGPRGRPANGWASLTPTEREVAGVVAEGLTNPQIGARLFMSRGTVKTHLSHIYAKLGVAGRTELAAAAVAEAAGSEAAGAAATQPTPAPTV
ncbi:LuxR C-terminal-related transcriptional regulator [Leifsonia sp. NPDC102414]|uniref:helix-turn-helix transcriptional regulator n=1 Tax=Leifsonia sp. NPDC102414 TaxID=3364124 RepID=UPI00381CB2BF